jgi:hypothetical protein
MKPITNIILDTLLTHDISITLRDDNSMLPWSDGVIEFLATRRRDGHKQHIALCLRDKDPSEFRVLGLEDMFYKIDEQLQR